MRKEKEKREKNIQDKRKEKLERKGNNNSLLNFLCISSLLIKQNRYGKFYRTHFWRHYEGC